MRRALLVLALLCAAFGISCEGDHPSITEAEAELIGGYVSRDAPAPQHALDIVFEDKIALVGYDVDQERWTAGDAITITWYWQVLSPLQPGWRIFTHVVDARGSSVLNADGIGDVRSLYPPDRWQEGEYIRDPQRLVLPPSFRGERATIMLGLWNGPHRMHVVRGPHDVDERAEAATLETVPRRQRRRVIPRIEVRLADTPPTIDGVADEAVWARAASTAAFRETRRGHAAEFRATAKVLYDADHLYVAFDVADDFLKTRFENHDEHVWEEDCVEIFLDPGGRGRNYFELQVSPRGVTFDTRYDRRRHPQPFGHVDWEPEFQQAVSVRGTVNDDDVDRGYTVEVAIPWTALRAGSPIPEPPTAGTQWRGNFYVVDARQNGQRAAAWAPPRVPDFHATHRFGFFDFVGPAGAAPTEPSSATTMRAASGVAVTPTMAAPDSAAAPTMTSRIPTAAMAPPRQAPPTPPAE